MQFKRQGQRVQVLAYRGYDKEKRRAIVKMLGSYDAYSYEPTVGLIDSLTEEEKKELQSHIENERHKSEKMLRQYDLTHIASRIKNVADTVQEDGFEGSEAWAAETWEAIDTLTKALRKAGYSKPKKAPQRHESPQYDLQHVLKLVTPTQGS